MNYSSIFNEFSLRRPTITFWNRVVTVATLLVTLGWNVQAQPLPAGVVVNPTPTALQLKLWPTKAVYAPGERLGLNVYTNAQVYLTLYAIDETGRVNVLFPNAFEPDNRVGPGTSSLPGDRYSWVVTGAPHAVEVVQALASVKPLDLLSLVATPPDAQAPFASLGDHPRQAAAQVQALIEHTLDADQWTAAWVQFRVLATEPSRWRVRSQPSGAALYLDGAFVGLTPTAVPFAPAALEEKSRTVTLTLVKRGFEAWSRTLTLTFDAGGALERVRFAPEQGFQLHRRAQQGDVTFLEVTLQPEGTQLDPGELPSSPPNEHVDFHRLNSLNSSFALNLGGHPQAVSSFGLELGVGALKLGFSLADTAEPVPTFFDLGGPANLGAETVYRQDPEFELYAKWSPKMELFGLGLELGVGVVTQTLAHIAAPALASRGTSTLDVSVLPNGYRSHAFQPTAMVGVVYRLSGLLLQLGYDTHRGVTGGLGVAF